MIERRDDPLWSTSFQRLLSAYPGRVPDWARTGAHDKSWRRDSCSFDSESQSGRDKEEFCVKMLNGPQFVGRE